MIPDATLHIYPGLEAAIKKALARVSPVSGEQPGFSVSPIEDSSLFALCSLTYICFLKRMSLLLQVLVLQNTSTVISALFHP